MVTRCIRPLWVVGPIFVAHQPGSIIFAVNLLWALLILFAPVRTPYLVINYHPLCCAVCLSVQVGWTAPALSSSLSFSAFVFRNWLSIFDGGVKRVCETLMG